MRIAQYCTIFLSQNFLCFNLVSLQVFFGFTFNTKSSIFKAKTPERKLFCRQINRSRALFSFPSYDWLYFFQSWRVLYKKTSIERRDACTIFTGKKFLCISQGMKKKTWVIYRFVKIFENYVPLCVFFSGIMRVMCSEPNYAIS